jgi:hypothetical protein
VVLGIVGSVVLGAWLLSALLKGGDKVIGSPLKRR